MSPHSPQTDTPRRPIRGRALLPTLTLPRPRCPQCGGIRLKKYRSVTDQGDGSALSWVVCRDEECAHRFRVLLE